MYKIGRKFIVAVACTALLGSCVRDYPSQPILSVLAANTRCSGTNTISISGVQPLYPTSAPNWNDYVEADGTTQLSASDTLCSGSGLTYSSCLHGGLMRVAYATNRSSCEGLSVADGAGVLHWICDDSTGSVRLISVGFESGKGLADLIDFTAADFRTNSIQVTDSCGVHSSAAQRWWNNPVIADPPAGNLNTSSAIYIVRSNLQRLYTITSPNIGLVVQPGVSLSGDLAPGGIVVDVSATRYLWLEGDFRLPNDLGAIRLNGTSYARVHNVRIDAGGQVATWGLRMTGASNNRIDHFTFSGQGDFGIRLEAAANYNTLFDIKRSNGWQSLVQLNASDNNIVVGFLTTSVNSNAMAQTSGNRNIFLNGASIFASDGFYGGAGQLSLVNFVAAANGADGINFINASKSTVADAVSSHNQGNGVIVSNNNTFEYFTGILEFASNGSSHCTGDLTRGIRNGCGFDELSDYSLAFGADLTSSFVGSVSSDDSANTTAMDGSGRTVGPISDPWNFENRFRAWGKDAGAFPGVPGNLGLCTTNCRLWDFSLRNGDTRLRNRFGIPNGSLYRDQVWTAGTLSACKTIPGALWQSNVCDVPGAYDAATCAGAGGGSGTWQTNLCSSRFLQHAFERPDDGIGNDNGLCESNEDCIFAPNIGAYQGHGSLVLIGPIADGTITGVRLYRYATNGR